MDLSGEWSFELDPDDRGGGEAWYSRRLRDTVRLPGSLTKGGWSRGSATDAVADVGGLRCVDHPNDLQLDA
jgi:hypothetical protein